MYMLHFLYYKSVQPTNIFSTGNSMSDQTVGADFKSQLKDVNCVSNNHKIPRGVVFWFEASRMNSVKFARHELLQPSHPRENITC